MEKSRKPPRFAKWISDKFSSKYTKASLNGDLEEEFLITADKKGIKYANRWFRRQILKSILPSIKHLIFWSFVMFKNYLKISFRNIKRRKGFSFINISGLAIGIACSILLFIYIQYELSYDKYHENADRIYRLNLEMDYGDHIRTTARSSPPMGPALCEDFPEITDFVRLYKTLPVIGYGKRHFYETVFFTDNSIFNIFSFKLKKGNPETALKEPRSIVLTEKMAEKYFGNEEPIGKTLNIWETRVFTVSGIMEEIPRNSHFTFDFLASWNSFNIKDGRTAAAGRTGNWMHLNYFTYVLLDKNCSPESIGAKISGYMGKYLDKNISDRNKIRLQPLFKIHLYSQLDSEINPNNDIKNIYLFGGVSLLIIIIACINYINLSTARFISRSKEVGIRKTVGAHRLQLIRQFYSETFLFTVFSFLLGIFLGMYRAKKRDIDPNKIMDLSVVIVISAILGARFLYVIFHLEEFRGHWMDMINPFQSSGQIGIAGLTMLGGFLAALASSLIYMWRHKLPILKIADILAPSVGLGIFITRIGCFFNGCCYGTPTKVPWAVVFPPESAAGYSSGIVNSQEHQQVSSVRSGGQVMHRVSMRGSIVLAKLPYSTMPTGLHGKSGRPLRLRASCTRQVSMVKRSRSGAGQSMRWRLRWL